MKGTEMLLWNRAQVAVRGVFIFFVANITCIQTLRAEAIKHTFLAVDNGKDQLLRIDQIHGMNWVTSIPSGARDLQLLDQERVLVSHASGVTEYDVATGRKLGWSASGFTDVNTARRLTNGNTLLGMNSAAGIVIAEIDPEGKKIDDLLLPGMKDLRLLRSTTVGSLLFTVSGPYRVIEVDRQGRSLWSAPLDGKGYVAQRLSNGNTMATTGETATVVEIDESGKVVWKVGGSANHARMLWFSGFHLLASGNVVVANWCGHGKEGQGPHIVEFTRDNRLVWSWEDHTLAAMITNVLVLDVTETTSVLDSKGTLMRGTCMNRPPLKSVVTRRKPQSPGAQPGRHSLSTKSFQLAGRRLHGAVHGVALVR